MPQATATRPIKFEARQQPRQRSWGRVALIVAAVAVVLAAIPIGLCRWRFGPALVLQDLREASGSEVSFRAFHQRVFPFPGCVIEGVAFRHGPDNKPLIAIEKLTIRGSYLGLLQTHVSRITAEGMLVSIPALGTGGPFRTTPSTVTVEEFVANGAAVEFAWHDPGKPPLRFDIHEATLRNVGPGRPFSYRMKVHNPEPPGEVTVEGKFGHWNRDNVAETPISGEYKFENADLSVYKGIAGKLFSTGKFQGDRK